MHNVPKEAKLLAYTSLCRLMLRYVDVVWDQETKANISQAKMIKSWAVRFTSDLKE